MKRLLQEIRRNPLLWLLVFVPVALAAEKLNHEAHTLHFILSVLAILPLAVLLSHATESVAAKTGDSVGGLLNATLGNLTELVIAIAALRAGQYTLVKASVAGAIVTNSLFMLGASFLLGGLRYHLQEFNRIAARFQAGLLFLATIGLLIPSAVAAHDSLNGSSFNQTLSVALSVSLLLGIRSWSLVLAQHASRIVRGYSRGTRSGVADRSCTDHASGRYDFGGAGERSVCWIRSVRRYRFRNESCVCWIHHCGFSRRSCRNGGGIFRRAQKSSRPQRGNRVGQRRADCAFCCSGSGAAQLFDWSRAHGFEFVARSSGNDFVRNAHCLSGDHVRTLHVVCGGARDHGLSYVCHSTLPFAA
jgi:Sodium/calcium exchanger protein